MHQRHVRVGDRGAAAMGRRDLLGLAAGGAAAWLGGCAGSRPPGPAAPGMEGFLREPTPESRFILHSPGNAEMRFELLARPGYRTPIEAFFVRSHFPTPTIDLASWRLSIEGPGVEAPYQIGHDELLRLPQRAFTRYLDCAGSGRVLFAEMLHRPAEGDPWRFGAYGIAEWAGVPLRELLERARPRKSAAFVLGVGRDGVARPIPFEKACEEDTLVAHTMNAEPLPPDHGFPARLLVPGWVGIASIKWLDRLVVTEQPVLTGWNTKEYVLIGPDYPPQPPAEGPILTTQVMKSAVALPWPAVLEAGRRRVVGFAWSPAGKIKQVDVSLDGGRSFRPAELVGPNIERAGVRWEIELDVRPGDMTLTPRATDEAGHTQPGLAEQRWNRKGYLFQAMAPHPIRVVHRGFSR